MTIFQGLFDRVRKPPTWNNLRVVGNSGIAKMTILVPVFGYLILFNTNVIGYLELSGVFVWHGGDEPSYRLFFFYFGLSFIGLGSLIFQLRCPWVIKGLCVELGDDGLKAATYRGG